MYVGKIFGAKNIRITPICAKLQGIFAKWHNLASSPLLAGAGWSVHSSARSETLSIPQSVFILSKSFEILSPARQWSSWVRCQVLKYCLDLSICLFIIPHFDYGVIVPELRRMMRTATGHMCRGQTEQRGGVELETKAIQRFTKVSIVSYSRPSLMIIASATQFHVYLPWGQRPFSIVS